MHVCVLINAVIHVVLVSAALAGVIHRDLQHTGYGVTSSGCDKVGQILANRNDACSYIVCDHAMGSSSAEQKLVARPMPCAPGTSVSPDYNKASGSSNPCVVNINIPCNAPPITPPHRPHGKKGAHAGPPVRIFQVNTNTNKDHFPWEALHMMDLVWNRIQDKFKQMDHRKSLKSHPLVKLDLEKHMVSLQHLWERIRGLVGSMLQRKVRGSGKSVLKDRGKPGRSSTEISGLKNLWMSMWEKIRELHALEVEYAGAEEPLGLSWEDGETPGDKETDHHHGERYLERKQQQRLQGKSGRYGSPKKYNANDISRFDYSEPEWDVYDKKKMYRSKGGRRPPHGPVYADVEEERQEGPKAAIYPDRGEDRGEGHQNMAEHDQYQPPSHHEDHHLNTHPYTEDQYGDLYPDGTVPVEHQEEPQEYSPQDEHSYLQGEHQEGIGTVHDPLHLQYRDREEHQVDNGPQQEQQPGDYHHYDHKPENSGKSISSGYRESNNIEPQQAADDRVPDRGGPPPPPLEAVDEQFDLSMVPSGYGNHMPLNTLWVQMKDVLTSMMQNNKEELKNIPSDEELEEMKRKEAYMRQYEQEQSPPGGDHRYQEQSPSGGHGHLEQSPPGGSRHQEQSPPGEAHRSHQVLSNRPPNFVNYGSARMAGSDRGPQQLSQIKPGMTQPTAVTVKLPQNKQQFDDLKWKDSAGIDEQYEKAKQQWKKISQG